MFLILKRVCAKPHSPQDYELKPYVINTDKIRAVSDPADCELWIELDGGEVVIAEATLDDFVSIVGAKNLPGPWDNQ